MKTCTTKGCDKPSALQSIGGMCLEHQVEFWNLLKRAPRISKEAAEERRKLLKDQYERICY